MRGIHLLSAQSNSSLVVKKEASMEQKGFSRQKTERFLNAAATLMTTFGM